MNRFSRTNRRSRGQIGADNLWPSPVTEGRGLDAGRREAEAHRPGPGTLALCLAWASLLLVALGVMLVQGAIAQAETTQESEHHYVWQTANTGLTDLSVRTMARHPVLTSTLYLETERGAFKSVDNARTWFTIRSNDPGYTWGLDIAFAPDDPQTLYVADAAEGVLKSTNGGATWSHANEGLTCATMDTIDIAPTAPYTLYAGCSNQTSVNGGVFRSSDGGDHWTMIGLGGVPIHAIAVHPVTPSLLYVGTWSSLVMSDDGGEHWRYFPTITADVTAFAFDPHDPKVVYAGTWQSSLYKSVNAGQQWTKLDGWTTSEMVIDPEWPYPLYAATMYGVRASWDGAATWENLGYPAQSSTGIVLDPERPGGGVLASASNLEGLAGVYRGAWLRHSLYLPLLLRH